LEEDPPKTSSGKGTGTLSTNPETLIRDAMADQYDIKKELGRGGMAIVYKAVQQNLGREVALKVLPQGMTHDRKMLERFHREAQSAAQLNHPHIVTIFDEGEINGVHYMAMEYLQGRNLHAIIKEKGPVSPKQAVSLIAPVAEALGYAHEEGTVHRDVKSSNVMVTDVGRPVLMDFGIAYAGSDARLTQTGTVLGTPEYMSPEQARGNEVDARGDLYSLGVVLYEALTAELPHTGGHPMSVVYKVLHESYTPPSHIRDEVPDWLEQIVAKLLKKDPGDRYQTGGEAAKALRAKDPGDKVEVPCPPLARCRHLPTAVTIPASRPRRKFFAPVMNPRKNRSRSRSRRPPKPLPPPKTLPRLRRKKRKNKRTRLSPRTAKAGRSANISISFGPSREMPTG
jgi:serine/threonine protein kinase